MHAPLGEHISPANQSKPEVRVAAQAAACSGRASSPFAIKGGIGTRANPRFALPRNPQVALAIGSDKEVKK